MTGAAAERSPHNGRNPLAPLVTGSVAATSRPDARVGEALRAIRLHLGMEVAFVSEFVGGRRVFRHVDARDDHCPVQVGGSDPLEESYCQRVVDGRLPELITDAAAVPEAARLPVTAALPVGAHLSVPITLSDGRVYGTFCCFSSSPDPSLTDRDLAMLRVLADLTAQGVEDELHAGRSVAAAAERVQAVLAGDGMTTAFQPIVEVRSRRAVGYEALARFADRTPDVWFEEAEQAGLGVELDLVALRAALRRFPSIPDGVYLALNVTPATVVSGRLAPALDGVMLERVVLEITEHAAIHGYDEVAAALRPLRGAGLRLAVDDAGAGYASFRHILRLEPDVIKLDMTLTRGIDHDPARRALAAALIGFARETGSSLVAEGVETDGELRTLESLGVSTAQGYLLGRPAPV